MVRIGENAFAGCDEELVIYAGCTEADAPEGWAEGWQGNATVIWLEEEESSEETAEDLGSEEATEAEPSCI